MSGVYRTARHTDHKGEYAIITMILPGIDCVAKLKPTTRKATIVVVASCLASGLTTAVLVVIFMIWGLHALGLLGILFMGFWTIIGVIDVVRLIRRRASVRAGRRGDGYR